MNSEIILCRNIKMDKNYNNVLDYTEEEMVALCRQNAVATANDYSFIRTNGNIFAGFTYNQCLQANYIAFQNKDYSNKWFFAWIDEVIYRGDKNNELRYTIDAWSTWFNRVTTKKCYINRQHVNDDTIGANTIDENLRVSEVVQEGGAIEDLSLSEYFWVAITTAWIPDDNTTQGGKQFSGIAVYNKQVFGTQLVLFKIRSLSDFLNVALFIIRTNGDGHIADIENIFIVPDGAIDETELNSHTTIAPLPDEQTQNYTFYTTQYTDTPVEFENLIEKVTSFSDFVPKNNKCFCYPYNYLFVSNNIGSQNIYKYEDFYNSNYASFKTQIVLNIGCSGRLVPTNYKKMVQNDDESLPLAKFPTCSWSSDAFTNWLTQQAVNQATDLAFGIVGMGQNYQQGVSKSNQQGVSSVGADVSLAVNIAGVIANQIGNFYTGELMPNIKGGTNTGDVNFACNRNVFTFRRMRAKTEVLRIIDDYFTRYGYAIKRLENPNITGRENWNYVEIATGEEIGYGNVPSNFMEIINNAFRKGVTIWHSHANLGNFNLSNNIIE